MTRADDLGDNQSLTPADGLGDVHAAKPGIRVTVEDLETGSVETTEIWNDYFLICAGNRYLDTTQTYSTGTHVLTIRRDH